MLNKKIRNWNKDDFSDISIFTLERFFGTNKIKNNKTKKGREVNDNYIICRQDMVGSFYLESDKL